MARDYEKIDALDELAKKRRNVTVATFGLCLGSLFALATSFASNLPPSGFVLIGGLIPAMMLGVFVSTTAHHVWTERQRKREIVRRNGSPVLGSPPDRTAFRRAIEDARARGRLMIDRYLVGFELDTGHPIWITDEEICGHGAVF